jgi:hypothetical protein
MHSKTQVVLLFSVTVLAAIVLASSKSKKVDLCSWQSKTRPDALKGNQGSSSHDKYWFSHQSDVDKEREQHHFIFAIENKHPVNYLPAEWLRGDGQPQVAFKRITPGKCASNDFSTTYGFKEDPKGIIKYGPLKKHLKDAPLYVVVESKKTDLKQEGPELKSRIIAELQEEGQENHRLHLEFTTQLEGREVMYTVTNRGTKREAFRIPAFSNAWDKASKVTELEFRSRWVTENKTFVVRADRESRKHVVRFEAEMGFRENLVPVQVLTREGTPMATGQITVYLPVVKE